MKRLIICLAVPILIALQSASGEATTISAPSVTVGVGDTVIIPVSIADAVDLTSWQFDMSFAPAIVRADSVDEGPFMSSFGTTLFVPGVIDNLGGSITIVSDFFVDLPPDPSGSGVLASIQFHALAPGVSPLHFSNVFLNLADSGFQIADGQITVTGPGGGPGGPGGPSPVPEPATLTLIASGIALAARRRRRTAALVVAALAIFGAAPAHAQTAAPYYAMPAWDQTLPSGSRFIVLWNFVDVDHPVGGAAVLDRETGLVWERTPSTTDFSWLDAMTHCTQSGVGGRMGWKLPTIQEILSLNDPSVTTFPFLPPGHPFAFNGGQHFTFWTSTASAGFADHALQGNFVAGVFPRAISQPKGGTTSAWCVRGGQSIDAQ